MEYIGRQLSTGAGIFSDASPLKDTLNLFLVQAVIIISVTRILSFFGSYLKQPRVIFEVIGGIILGPSALGRNKRFTAKLFYASSLSYLSLVANIGLVLYLYLVGLELDPAMLSTHAKRAGSIAIAGMVIPFCLGVGVSVLLYNKLLKTEKGFEDVSFTSFFVFCGTAMCITAFPVLARILKEGGLIYSRPGAMTLGAAALNDALAWCLLILAISIANAGDMITAFYVFLCVVGLALVLFFIIRPVFSRVVSFAEHGNSPILRGNLFALTIVLIFLCAWTTALLGVDAIFGAFLFGLIVPRDSLLFRECNEYIEHFVLTIMLPLYFTVSGLKTDITQINDATTGLLCILVIVLATIGKVVGCGATAYFSGLKKRESLVVAVLMNTRGLVELIVLNLGVSSGILNVKVFTIMVLMALVTTFMTCPLVEFIYPLSKRKYLNATATLERVADLQIEGGPSLPRADVEAGGRPSLGEVTLVPMEFNALSNEFLHSSKVAIVLDRLEQMSWLLDVLYLIAPVSLVSELAVTAMQFIEPTLTDKDRFLGLAEDGRLIHVANKNYDLAHLVAHYNTEDVGGSALVTSTGASVSRYEIKDAVELLPVSMFCHTIGADSYFFRIEGDPDEYPRELQRLAQDNSVNLLLLPWRASHYVERFFWGLLPAATAPIALVVKLSQSALPPRHTSQSPLSPIREDPEESHSSHGSSASPTEPGHVAPRRSLRSVLVVITGAETDPFAIVLVQRLVERKHITVTVLVAEDESLLPATLTSALAQVRGRPQEYPGVTFVIPDGVNSGVPAVSVVSKELSKQPYDVVITGFVEPDVAVPDSAALQESSRARRRTASFTATIAQNLKLTPDQPSPEEEVQYKRSLGMSEKLAYSDLRHPELGVVGDRLLRLHHSHSTYIMVLHSPVPKKPHSDGVQSERRPSASATVLAPRSDSFSNALERMVRKQASRDSIYGAGSP